MPDGTLYADSTRANFYWIPRGTMVPAGELTLRSLSGEVRQADPEAIAEYRIDEARAKELTRATMADLGARASKVLGGIGSLLQEASGRPKAPMPSDGDALAENVRQIVEGLGASLRDLIDEAPAARDATEERLRRLAERAGIDPEKIDPEELRRKVQEVVGNPELVSTIEGATSRLRGLTADLERSLRELREQPLEPEEPDVVDAEEPEA